jgi:hypothetical protein
MRYHVTNGSDAPIAVRVVASFQLSALTRRARRLCGERLLRRIHRRDAENAEVDAEKKSKTGQADTRGTKL